MKEKIIALCDTEEAYVRRFCDYVCGKKEYPFDMAAFTSLERLLSFDQLQEIALLLISEAEYDPVLENKIRGQIIILQGNPKETQEEVKSGIYKFQPCDMILREAMYYCDPENMPAVPKANKSGKLKIIGLFTPIHGLGQTTMALTLGQILAMHHKTLYLNFESFSGFPEKFQKTYSSDMTDLIYYLSNARGSLFYKLQSMIQTCGDLDYIPPAFSYLDLHQIYPGEWVAFLQEMEENSPYEYLLLDLSENVQGLFEILERCDPIFSLTGWEKEEMEKWNQYRSLLEKAGRESILAKTIQWDRPKPKELPKEPWLLPESKAAHWAGELMEKIK